MRAREAGRLSDGFEYLQMLQSTAMERPVARTFALVLLAHILHRIITSLNSSHALCRPNRELDFGNRTDCLLIIIKLNCDLGTLHNSAARSVHEYFIAQDTLVAVIVCSCRYLNDSPRLSAHSNSAIVFPIRFKPVAVPVWLLRATVTRGDLAEQNTEEGNRCGDDGDSNLRV